MTGRLFGILAAFILAAACNSGNNGEPVPSPDADAADILFESENWPLGESAIKLSMNYGEPVYASAKLKDGAGAAEFQARFSRGDASGYVFYAVGPAASLLSADAAAESFTVNIPPSQSGTVQILAAVSSPYGIFPKEAVLNFGHLTAYGKLVLSGLPEGANPLSVKIASPRPLAGRWIWKPGSGGLSEPVEGTSGSINVNRNAEGEFVFACAPVDLSGSELSVTLNMSGEPVSKTFTLPESTVLNAGNTTLIPLDFGVEPGPEPETNKWIANNALTEYSIVGASWLSSDNEDFISDLKTATGAAFATLTLPQRGEKEILIGCAADSDVFADMLRNIKYGYSIAFAGDDLVIAGTDHNWTVLAMEAFGREALSKADGQELCLDSAFGISESVEDPEMIARLLKADKAFTVSAELVGSCEGSGTMKVAQGAASDGQYVYFVMRDSNDTQAIVFKATLDTFELVGRSAVFQGYHCNDMTFDTAHDRALVVHGTGDSKGLTAVDGSTLQLSTIKTSIGIGGMTYSPSRNQYGITQSGSKYVLADESFRQIRDIGRYTRDAEGSKDYTAQGMGSDESFVYFPMSGKSDNILVVYGWNGVVKDTIHVPVKIESESMFYAAGNYYMMFDGSSHYAFLYKITPEIHYNIE